MSMVPNRIQDSRFFTPIEWKKSSHSEQSLNCVEVAIGDRGVLMRDSKDRAGGVLSIEAAAWEAFVDEVKRGAFDW